MRVNDARDLFAYIEDAAAGRRARPRPMTCPSPSTFAGLLGGWKFLFFDPAPFVPDPSKDAQWNRGAYLVEGPGHCAECHSPRNFLGAIKPDKRFSGGPDPEGKGWVPNITPHADGIGSWSKDRHRGIPEERLDARIRLGGRQHGRGGPEHRPPQRCRPHGDGDIHRLAAVTARQGAAKDRPDHTLTA